MTVLAILMLIFGIALASDGAFSRGLFVSLFSDPSAIVVLVIRLSEVLLGGLVLVVAGFVFSTS